MKDKYDLAIEYLTKQPLEIFDAWGTHQTHPAGCLFDRASKNRYSMVLDQAWQEHLAIGCLTQIRAFSDHVAATPELTEAIRNDERIPKDQDDITVDTLPVFAEWQRRLDKELNRA